MWRGQINNYKLTTYKKWIVRYTVLICRRRCLFGRNSFVLLFDQKRIIDWKKKVRKPKKTNPISGVREKKPNGKRLADHYPWNYKIVDWDATRLKSILLTKQRLAGRAGQHVSQCLLSLSGLEMVIFFVLVKCDVDKSYLDPSNITCFGGGLTGNRKV